MEWYYLAIIPLLWTSLGIWGICLTWKHLQTSEDPRDRRLAKNRTHLIKIFIKHFLLFPPRFLWDMRGLFSDYLPRVLQRHSTLTTSEAKIVIALPIRAMVVSGALIIVFYLAGSPIGIWGIALTLVGTFIISVIHALIFDVPHARSK